MTELSYTHFDSPVGSLLVAGDDVALHYLCFPNSPNAIAPRSDWHQTDAPFLEVRRQLTAYFNGELRQFDLPLFSDRNSFSKKRLATPVHNTFWRDANLWPIGDHY